jgi:hypothetical protein
MQFEIQLSECDLTMFIQFIVQFASSLSTAIGSLSLFECLFVASLNLTENFDSF